MWIQQQGRVPAKLNGLTTNDQPSARRDCQRRSGVHLPSAQLAGTRHSQPLRVLESSPLGGPLISRALILFLATGSTLGHRR